MRKKKTRNQYEFDKRKYDHIHLQVGKGNRSEIQAHAGAQGESMNRFIRRAIAETMERDLKEFHKEDA